MFRLNRLLKLAIVLVLCAGLVMTGSGCSEKGVISDSDYEKLADNAISEFMSYTEVPHQTLYTDDAEEYLLSWAKEHEFKYGHDESGNVWIDIPATEGYEDVPSVMLHAHMDMYCAADEGIETDLTTEAVTAVDDGEYIRGDGTTLGADNGIGVGMMLALAQQEFDHGAVRLLFTTDSEWGYAGAKGLDPKVMNSDMLIDLDGTDVKSVTATSAGIDQIEFKKTMSTMDLEGLTVLKMSIDGMSGGDAGSDITQNRVNAIRTMAEILKKINDVGIETNIISIYGGTSMNDIEKSAEVVFAVLPSSVKNVTVLAQRVTDRIKEDFPEETINCTIIKLTDYSGSTCYSASDSAELADMLDALPQGVMHMSSDINDYPLTSVNIGTVKIEDKTAVIDYAIRSSESGEMESREEALADAASGYGFSSEQLLYYPGWTYDKDSELLKKTCEALNDAGAGSTEIKALNSTLETAWLCSLNEKMQAVSIGANISGSHTTSETLDKASVEVVLRSLVSVLQDIAGTNTDK